jgi:RNA polymerase sigma-70 factor (ECF subfamily)
MPEGVSPDHAPATAERDELATAMASLDEDQRIAVMLRFWLDMSVDDIAEKLGVPPGTVKSRLHRAMGKLRLALEGLR